MDAGAPWIEALGLQSDLPIVELTNSDLFGLDKEDDNLGTQDFGVIEPLVEITSPVQELEHVENLSENSFCMLEPEVRINTPEPRTNSPEPHTVSPDLQAMSPEVQAMSPEVQAMSPEVQAMSPEVQAMSPEMQAMSPEVQAMSPDLQEMSPEVEAMSPDVQAMSPDPQEMSPEPQMISPEREPQMNTSDAENCSTPDVEILPQEIRLDSPEVFTIDDSPEKILDQNNSKEIETKENYNQAIFDDGDRDLKKELQIKLIRIDHTLTIIDNMVRLPEHMCGSESETSSTRNGRRSSKSKVRVTNKRSPYSLRIKPEPVDEEDPSTSNVVRFNPYALSAQKQAANKRNSVGAKGKLAKGRQTQPAHSQPDEADNDFFSPADFLEASMSEGNSPDKKQTWSGTGSDSSLLEKTLTLVGRKPVNMIRNGTPLFVNAPASANAGMLQPERLSSFRSGLNNSKGEDTLAKVMANSCLSLTHRPKTGKMSGPAGARKTPGQRGMVNHDHQYSSRLSNENVTRLEAQIKSLQAEADKLRKQLAAANAYIATSLSAAVQPTPPSRIYQPTTFAPPLQSHTQTIRSNTQVFRAQSIRAQPQAIRVQAQATRAQAQVVRGQQFRAQTVRPQQFRQRAPGPVRANPYHRAANPGVMVVPVRKQMQAITLRPLRASTQALTVIPIRRGPRAAEPETEMPSFEQVNVNEHFGMHFLTE